MVAELPTQLAKQPNHNSCWDTNLADPYFVTDSLYKWNEQNCSLDFAAQDSTNSASGNYCSSSVKEKISELAELQLSENIVDEFAANKLEAIKKYSDWQELHIRTENVGYSDGAVNISYRVLPIDMKEQTGDFKGWDQFLKSVQATASASGVVVECRFAAGTAPSGSQKDFVPVKAKLIEYTGQTILLKCEAS
jgi:hypothetical protein